MILQIRKQGDGPGPGICLYVNANVGKKKKADMGFCPKEPP